MSDDLLAYFAGDTLPGSDATSLLDTVPDGTRPSEAWWMLRTEVPIVHPAGLSPRWTEAITRALGVDPVAWHALARAEDGIDAVTGAVVPYDDPRMLVDEDVLVGGAAVRRGLADTGLAEAAIAPDGFLLPPSSRWNLGARLALPRLRERAERLARMVQLRAPRLVLLNELRMLERFGVDVYDALRARLRIERQEPEPGRARRWARRQAWLFDEVDHLFLAVEPGTPASRAYRVDLEQGSLRWVVEDTEEERVRSDCFALGSWSRGDGTFLAASANPSLAHAKVADAPERLHEASAETEPEAFACATWLADHAGAAAIFRVPTSAGALFVGVMRPRVAAQ